MYKIILKKYYPFIIIIAGLVISNIYFIIRNDAKQSCNAVTELEKEVRYDDEETLEYYKVDIKGEIKKPGVYNIEKGSSINDLIKLAGGITKNGTTKNLNLARTLSDQSVVVIKNKKNTAKEEVVSIPCVCPEYEITKCPESSIIEITKTDEFVGEGEQSTTKNDESSNTDTKISLNNGSLTELMTLPGIGEAKAKAIISYREENGKFNDINEITKVSGISESIFNKIKDFIKL